MLGWMLLRAAVQSATALCLARILGATQYGQFIAAIAIAGFIAPLAGLGLQGVLLSEGARDAQAVPTLLGGVLDLNKLSLPAAWLMAVALARWMLPGGINVIVIVLVLGAEIAASSLIELLGRTEQALHRSSRFGAMQAGLSLVRFGTLVPWAVFSRPTAASWMVAYSMSSAAYVIVMLLLAIRRHAPRNPGTTPWKLAAKGLPFASGAAAMRIQSELNKPLLAHVGWSLAADLSLSQRIVDLANLPLVAMQEALWSRVYASSRPQARLRHVGLPMVAAALTSAAVLALAAPLLPLILGPGYAESAHALRLLAAVPAIQLLRNLGNASLVASGHASALTRVYLFSGAISIVTTAVLIKLFGLDGAIAAAYANELVTLVAQRLFAPKARKHPA